MKAKTSVLYSLSIFGPDDLVAGRPEAADTLNTSLKLDDERTAPSALEERLRREQLHSWT
jgi:hypothetical protein